MFLPREEFSNSTAQCCSAAVLGRKKLWAWWLSGSRYYHYSVALSLFVALQDWVGLCSLLVSSFAPFNLPEGFFCRG